MAHATPKMRELVFKKFGERCFYCGTIDGDPIFTVDHVVPTSMGGKNVHTNMVPSCTHCNCNRKKNKPPTVAQLHSLKFYWGVSHIPESRFQDLADGKWKPLFEILSGERNGVTRRQRMWLRNPACHNCGEKTYFHVGEDTKDMEDNAACLTNDNKGEVKRIFCWSCVKRRDKNPAFQLSRNNGIFA